MVKQCQGRHGDRVLAAAPWRCRSRARRTSSLLTGSRSAISERLPHGELSSFLLSPGLFLPTTFGQLLRKPRYQPLTRAKLSLIFQKPTYNSVQLKTSSNTCTYIPEKRERKALAISCGGSLTFKNPVQGGFSSFTRSVLPNSANQGKPNHKLTPAWQPAADLGSLAAQPYPRLSPVTLSWG